MSNLDQIPDTLPVPENDGGADHLIGMKLADIKLPATTGEAVSLAERGGLLVLYAYPMTGRPDTPLPVGWDEIPGARGCTPQSCSFRDHMVELKDLGVDHVFGISTQAREYQKEAAERLHLPFPLLSDGEQKFQTAMNLPVMKVDVVGQNNNLLKRLALVIENRVIKKVFYPVFPPDRNAADVLEWLKSRNA
ncbi:MAG: peroxiredoxin [Pseudomonadota bacterium]